MVNTTLSGLKLFISILLIEYNHFKCNSLPQGRRTHHLPSKTMSQVASQHYCRCTNGTIHSPDRVRRKGSPFILPECLSSGGGHASITFCSSSRFCSFSWLTCSSKVEVYSCLRCRDLAALSRFFTCNSKCS